MCDWQTYRVHLNLLRWLVELRKNLYITPGDRALAIGVVDPLVGGAEGGCGDVAAGFQGFSPCFQLAVGEQDENDP